MAQEIPTCYPIPVLNLTNKLKFFSRNSGKMKSSILVWALLQASLFSSRVHCLENVISLSQPGDYFWELILDIDNSNNTGTLCKEIQVIREVSGSYDSMLHTLETSTIKTEMKLSGTLFDVINVGVTGSLSSELKSHYEKLTNSHQDYFTKTNKTDVYEVGGRSKLKLYRLVFSGPGMTVRTDTISSTPHNQTVELKFYVRQRFVLRDIQVVYSEASVDRPDNLITEARGRSPDVNKGFGGKYVWLVPVWTKDLSLGATGVEIVVQESKNPNYNDLAAGAGGKYRYVKMLRDSNAKQRIKEISLWRADSSSDKARGEGKGFQFMTQDINAGRMEEYLYLAWNAVYL